MILCIVLHTTTGPRCVSTRRKTAVWLAQEAVQADAADEVDPVFVRSKASLLIEWTRLHGPTDLPSLYSSCGPLRVPFSPRAAGGEGCAGAKAVRGGC